MPFSGIDHRARIKFYVCGHPPDRLLSFLWIWHEDMIFIVYYNRQEIPGHNDNDALAHFVLKYGAPKLEVSWYYFLKRPVCAHNKTGSFEWKNRTIKQFLEFLRIDYSYESYATFLSQKSSSSNMCYSFSLVLAFTLVKKYRPSIPGP